MGEKIIIPGKQQDERVFWIFQICFWVAISVVMMVLFATFRPGQSGTAMTILGRGCTGFLLTYGLSRVYRNPRVRRISGITKWLFVILCTLIACGIGTLIWIVIPLVLPIRDKLHETLFWEHGYCSIRDDLLLVGDLLRAGGSRKSQSSGHCQRAPFTGCPRE